MGLVTSLYVVDGDTREKLKTRVKSGKKLKEKIPPKIKWATVLKRQFARVNVNWPIAEAGEADSVSSLSALACHIGGPIDVNPGELTLVYDRYLKDLRNLVCQFCLRFKRDLSCFNFKYPFLRS